MNRETKFRAFCDVDTNKGSEIKMIYFSHCELDNGLWFNPDDDNIYHINEWLSKPMQFTGLKDKNEVDIYDSDIVRLNGWGFNGQDDGLTKIIWDNDVLGWNFEKSNYAEDRYDFRKAINNCEVVGNIYSNPDLLT